MDYIQIDRTNYMELILHKFPAFRTQWAEHLAAWNLPLARPIAVDVTEFADFAVVTIGHGIDAEIDRLAEITELMLMQDDPVIDYAFRTLFLEQISLGTKRGGVAVDRFTHKLRPLGSYHWQALDLRVGIYPSGVSID
ncbi:hypothetical protein [Chamaesiphon sp.]|uniref:DUF7674 family protein n=1 Tax=Chamaesiphon sp. TaxID=2814140 RepID=UPI003593BB70